MITIKVDLNGTSENRQKLSLSFSKIDVSVIDIIESLSEMYQDLNACFFDDKGDLMEGIQPRSADGKSINIKSLLKDGDHIIFDFKHKF